MKSRRLALLIVVALLGACAAGSPGVVPPAASAAPAAATPVASSSWGEAEGSPDDQPQLAHHLRFRRFEAGFDRSRYPVRVSVHWLFDQPLPSGLPRPFEDERARRFEARLVDAVQRDDVAVLAMAVTGRGQRELVFFARAADAFSSRLTAVPPESGSRPVKVASEPDPGWAYYDDEVGGLQR